MFDLFDDLRLLARYLFLTVAAAVSTPLWCAGVQTLETVEVKADATGLIGMPILPARVRIREIKSRRDRLTAAANYWRGRLASS